MARSLQHQLSASATFLLSTLFTYQLVSGVQSSHVLLVPMPYPSHVSQWTSIGNGLLERGHHVTILLSSSYPELERIRNEFQFQVVDYAVISPDFFTTPTTEATWDEWITNALLMDPIEEMRTNAEAQKANEFCTNPLADESLPDRLLRSAYGRPDLAIVDAIPHYRCMWILCHRLGIPYVSMTTQYDPWTWRTPALPSFVPFPYAAGGQLTEKMTFWQRVENIRTLIDWTAWPQLEIIENQFVQRYLPDETYATLAARNLLWFFDTDAVVEYPRPTMPNEINVGGLSTSPSHPIKDEKLRNFAERSTNRLVIVSFGSMDFVSNRFFQDFFSVFKQVTELNFIWRYNGEIPMEYKQSWPENILPQEQIPQNDLLGHNNTVLFISHCGANSQFEAVYHGVPMICLAVWGDQMYNAQRMQYRGYGSRTIR